METTGSYNRMGSYYNVDGKSHIHWIFSAFLSLLFLGVGNFIIGNASTINPSEFMLTISMVYLICMISLGIFHMIQLCIRDGDCPSLYPSSIITSENGLIGGFTIGIIGGIFLFIGEFFLVLAESSSITFISLCGIPPITSFLSFVFFKEKLSILQTVGMIISVGGIIYLDAFDLKGDWKSYAYGIGAMFSFSFRNLTARAMESKGISIYTGVMLSSAGEVMSGVVLLVWAYVQDFNELFIDGSNFVKSFAGSFLIVYSLYFMNHSIATGTIGVVVTILNCNGVVYLLLRRIFEGSELNMRNIIGISIISFGVVILLLGDQLRYWLVSNRRRNNSSISTIF